ncbi:MAG: hypothetical protein P8H13_10200 [Polaribacter sp.]|nr:hypothetical protein [Polaribacter sp.]MDG1993599.1 hypothetical protein [Polaribacter sp.]
MKRIVISAFLVFKEVNLDLAVVHDIVKKPNIVSNKACVLIGGMKINTYAIALNYSYFRSVLFFVIVLIEKTFSKFICHEKNEQQKLILDGLIAKIIASEHV